MYSASKIAGFGHFGQNGHSGQSGFTLNVNGGAGKENWLSRQRVKFAQFAIDKLRPAYSLPIVPPHIPQRKVRPRMTKYRVIAMLRNRSGDIVPMRWLLEGDRFQATHTVMGILAQDNDEWTQLVSIHVDAIEGE